MKPDKTLKVLLVGILLALLANLCKPLLSPTPATAQAKPPGGTVSSPFKKAVAAMVTEWKMNPGVGGTGANRQWATEWAVVYDDGTMKKFAVKLPPLPKKRKTSGGPVQ